MNDLESGEMSAARPQGVFVTTHWSKVLEAGGDGTSQSHAAMDQLCSIYWYPLYAFVRRQGYTPHDSQDLTQEFFARLLQENWVAQADRKRGRFRSFLLTAMKNFMANEWHKAHAQKRGGHQPIASLNDEAEQRYQFETPDNVTPETLFERSWALALLDDVLARMAAEYDREGRLTWFETLRSTLTADCNAIPYADMAQALGSTESAVRVATHRLRQRYRQLIREEVAHTVSSPHEVDEELRHLFHVLAG